MIDIVRFKQDFVDRFGCEPRIFRAPARVNLIGEHTDYNDGFVLPFAINKAVYVAAAPRDDRRLAVYSEAFPEMLEFDLEALSSMTIPSDWTRYPFGVISSINAARPGLRGADLLIASDIPSGAGLSSSAALEVAIATALDSLFDLNLSPVEIAKIGRATENEFAGVNSGIMDQMGSVLGSAGQALFLDCRSLEWQHIPLENASFLICDTRTKHSLAESEYNTRRRECEEAAAILGKASLRDARIEEIDRLPSPLRERARHVISENERVEAAVDALRIGDLKKVGELMNASHASLRDDFQVSSRELDVMAEICRTQAPVLGSRMMGGGFGGCTVSLFGDVRSDKLESKISAEYVRRTGIEPGIFRCRPMQGVSELIGQTNYGIAF